MLLQYCGMKRKHKEVRASILGVLNDGQKYSYGHLERKVNTNWQTIRDHCEDLILFELAKLTKDNKMKITQKGREFLKKLN
jgi:predicted transcriptional regulator